MVYFNSLAPGQTVWRKVHTRQGGTKLRAIACTPVRVLAIDATGERVQAQWGNNPPRWFGSDAVRLWSRRRPRGLPEAIYRKTLLQPTSS